MLSWTVVSQFVGGSDLLTGHNWSSLVATWKGESIHRRALGTLTMITSYSHSGTFGCKLHKMINKF
jgi:hypothetical protein